MNFGVPNQRTAKKVEKYPDTAVMTLSVYGGKGTSRAMMLNKKAVELLGLPEEGAVVAFGFDVDEAGNCTGVYLMNGNQSQIPETIKIRVTKGNPRKISEKRTYEYLSEKAFQLDNSIENEFTLESLPTVGEITRFKLNLMKDGIDELSTNESVNESINESESKEEDVTAVFDTEEDTTGISQGFNPSFQDEKPSFQVEE